MPDRSERLDTVLMPVRLTAENGAKALLSGEFFIDQTVPNPDYDEMETHNSDEPEFLNERIPVPWTTIKEIYAMAVKGLGEEVSCRQTK